jgi:uncharacterized protein YcsI (UPF0317 family)
VKSWVTGLADDAVISGFDIRRDAPLYMVYKNGKLENEACPDIVDEWTEDHVAFFIGCSFSFETALTEAGLPPRHTVMGRNVPMYRSSRPLCKAGVFQSGTYVVSMRPYKKSQIERVREVH